MALIPAILAGIYAHKQEKERLAKQAEAGADGGGGKLNFGPAISFDEAASIAGSFDSLGQNLLGQAGNAKLPPRRRQQMDFPTYKTSE